jgi:hypothetical protein
MSFTPTYTRTNVNVGQAQMYLQTYSSSAPAALPANSVAFNTPASWTALSWIPIGATDSGVTFSFQRKVSDIMVEEQQTPVQELSDSTDVHIEVTLAEDTLQQALWAMGGGTLTPSGGFVTLQVASDLQQYSVAFEAANQFGYFRRYLLQPCTSVGTAKVAYRRAKDKRMWITQFTYLDKLENMQVVERQS